MIEQSIINRATECLQCEAAAIEALIPRLDDSFLRAVEAIRDCKGKIVVTGVGKSGHIGSKIAATLASIGTPAFFLNPLDAYHGDLGMLSSDDLVLAISYSGATEELLRFLPLIQAKKIRIIAMSSSEESLLARCADIHLNIAVDHEADPLNLVPEAFPADGLRTTASGRRLGTQTAGESGGCHVHREPALPHAGYADVRSHRDCHQRHPRHWNSGRKRRVDRHHHRRRYS